MLRALAQLGGWPGSLEARRPHLAIVRSSLRPGRRLHAHMGLSSQRVPPPLPPTQTSELTDLLMYNGFVDVLVGWRGCQIWQLQSGRAPRCSSRPRMPAGCCRLARSLAGSSQPGNQPASNSLIFPTQHDHQNSDNGLDRLEELVQLWL